MQYCAQILRFGTIAKGQGESLEMAYIKVIKEDKAGGQIKAYYKKYGDPFTGVDNILKIHSLDPESLRYHYELYKHLMTATSHLSRMQREMIAIVVSKINACHY